MEKSEIITHGARARRWGPLLSERGVHYSVWAPGKRGLEARVIGEHGTRDLPMIAGVDGFHSVLDPEGRAGDRYQFRVSDHWLPDPASRAQAGTVHEASLVVDSRQYPWNDGAWSRPVFRDLVIYELHVGTFTPGGTFRSAIEKLTYLRDLGVNAIELMPIADFPGARSWGYDGVLIYAPARAYGSPDDLRALVDAAHALGIAVILDVVYNHFGPDGNYLGLYSSRFSTPRHHTPWGAGFNFDDEDAAPVREFFLRNPEYWMEEFHIDGFRLDATHEIADDSARHILAELTEVIHQRGGYAIAEDARNKREMLLPVQQGGAGFDAVWADDFHHSVRVSQTKENEAYFQHYEGSLSELMDTLQHGWHYRGQRSRASGKHRGTSSEGLPPSGFLHCISNHDQVGNRAFGERLSKVISPAAYRALSMLLCFTPGTPMIFMGQEWAASTPFQFFTDHNAELGRLITEGRRREFSGFSAFRDPATLAAIPDPQAEETFLASKLDWSELTSPDKAGVLDLYAECLHLRATGTAFRPVHDAAWRVKAIGEQVGAIRYGEDDGGHLLVFSLGGKATFDLSAEPFAKLQAGRHWRLLLTSDEPRFGGDGRAIIDGNRCVFGSAAAILLQSAA